jgi:crotonobetainyl-CoA:carnitine CoA-transferase CaiB-like acyl-CoA transferase
VSDENWPRLAQLVGRPELADDPRFSDRAARRRHRAEIDEIVRNWARGQTRQTIWNGLRELGYFGAPVLSLSEVMNDPHVQARGSFIERNHPSAGATKLVAPWIRLSDTPASVRADAPALGQHTDEILAELLGLTAEDLMRLRRQKAIS